MDNGQKQVAELKIELKNSGAKATGTKEKLIERSKMNIPFPVLTPRLVDSKWFNADSPCDEEAELTALEQANQHWLSSIGQQYMKRAPLGKTDPEPMEEEADTDEEEGNDESEETEESHDEDEEEELQTTYSPARNNNELEPDSLDDLNDAPELNTPDQSALY